jgi:hypothetical protein
MIQQQRFTLARNERAAPRDERFQQDFVLRHDGCKRQALFIDDSVAQQEVDAHIPNPDTFRGEVLAIAPEDDIDTDYQLQTRDASSDATLHYR